MIDLLRFVGLCALFVGAGLGLLRLAWPRLDAGLTPLLAPGLTQVIMTLVLGMAVIAGIPVRRIALPMWIVLIALAVYGLRGWLPVWSRGSLLLLSTAAIAPILAMLPYFVYGLAEHPGSGMLDGWAYAALGQYLWTYPRDTEGGLAPLYQFATHLGHTRFISGAGLAFLSWLYAPGDTQAANGLLRALPVFTLGAGCAAFAHVRRLALPFAVLFVAMTTISGWTIDVVWANNYDQGLALPYFPLLATLAIMLATVSWLGAVLTGAVAAAMLYTYPEFAVIGLGIAGLLGLEALIKARDARGLARGTMALAAAAVLSMPYWSDFRGFIVNQLQVGLQNTGNRPGEFMFHGLLDPAARLSALFALGGEQLLPGYLPWTTWLAGLLAGLCLIGLVAFLRRFELALPLVSVGLGAMVWVLLVRQAYGYGAYKVLALGWWVVMYFAITGIVALHAVLRRLGGSRWIIVGTLASIVPIVTVTRAVADTRTLSDAPMRDYRAIAQVPDLIDRAPLGLFIADTAAAHWAVYFLRDTDILVGVRPGYLGAPHLVTLMARARSVPPAGVRFVVVEAEAGGAARAAGWHLAWSRGRYGVWDTAPNGWTVVTAVHDALGHEVPLRPSFHAGPPDGATVDLLSSHAGTLDLSMRFFNTFSADDRTCWRLTMQMRGIEPRDLLVQPGPVRVGLPVPANASTFALRAVRTGASRLTGVDASREVSIGDFFTRLLPAAAKEAPVFTACQGS